MVKVSIIIPTYNSGKYITQAIDSVLNQSYRDFEIIVVDDGSTDNTREVLSPYIENLTIKYIYQSNQGPGAARNKGIEVASGKFICFLDGDDLLLNESFITRATMLEKNKNLALVFSDFYISFSQNNSPIVRLKSLSFMDYFHSAIHSQSGEFIIFNNSFYHKNLTFPVWPIWTGTVMLRKEIIDRIGKFRTDISIAEDVDFWLRAVKNNYVGYVNKPLSHYRRSKGVLTKNFENYYKGGINLREKVLSKEKSSKTINIFLINLIKNKISYEYCELGRYYLREYNLKKARGAFLNSIKNNFLRTTAYFFLFVSFLPLYLQKISREYKLKLKY